MCHERAHQLNHDRPDGNHCAGFTISVRPGGLLSRSPVAIRHGDAHIWFMTSAETIKPARTADTTGSACRHAVCRRGNMPRMNLADGFAPHTGVIIAEVGFLLILFAGIWFVAAEIPAFKASAARRIVAGRRARSRRSASHHRHALGSLRLARLDKDTSAGSQDPVVAAVYHEFRSGDVGGGIRDEESNELSHFGCSTRAPEGYSSDSGQERGLGLGVADSFLIHYLRDSGRC